MFKRSVRAVLYAAARSQGAVLLRQFRAATRSVASAQRTVLAEVLAQQADSEMGRQLGLGRIGDPETLRRRLPITTYEDVRPFINRMRDTGDTTVMFGSGERLLMFALTSGSDAEPKHIPVTAESHARYRRGWSTWVAQSTIDHRRSLKHHVLPIVSSSVERTTKHGVPCGSMSGLSTETQSRFVRTIYAAPPALYGIRNQAEKYYSLARWAASMPVSFLVTANPSSFLLLAKVMDQRAQDLIRDIRDGSLSTDWHSEGDRLLDEVAALRPDPRRAHFLESVLERTGHLYPKDVWPELGLITNWKGGTLGHYLDLYAEPFGATPVRDIGLLASEGRMTIPMSDAGSAGPLDLFSHFYEFMPVEEESTSQPATLLAHELEAGRQYYILLTNFSGLHRYNISDVIEVVDFMEQCPVVRFLHKGSRFSSITGEKLSEHQVSTAVHAAACELGWKITDFMLVPVWGEPPCYTLITGRGSLGPRDAWPRLLERVERQLQTSNIEYECKRRSMRLGHLRLGLVDDSHFESLRHERITASGGRAEQYKPTYLTPDLEYHRRLTIHEEVTVDDEREPAPMVSP